MMASRGGRGRTAPEERGCARGRGLSWRGRGLNKKGRDHGTAFPREAIDKLGGVSGSHGWSWGEQPLFPPSGQAGPIPAENRAQGHVVPEVIPAFHVFNLKAFEKPGARKNGAKGCTQHVQEGRQTWGKAKIQGPT